MEQHFVSYSTPECQRLTTLVKQLRGDAAKFWTDYQYFIDGYDKFIQELFKEFATPQAMGDKRAIIRSRQEKKEKEAAGNALPEQTKIATPASTAAPRGEPRKKRRKVTTNTQIELGGTQRPAESHDRREAIEATPNTLQTETADAKCKSQGKQEAVMQEAKEEETAHAETKKHATDSESGESVMDSQASEAVITVETEVELDNAETTQTETKTAEETPNPEGGDSDATQRTHAVVEQALEMVQETHNADAEAPQPADDAKVEVHDSKVKEQTSNSEAAALGKADNISSIDATVNLMSPQTEPNVDLSPTDATVKLEPMTIEELDKQDPKSQHQVPPAVVDDWQPTKCNLLLHGQSHTNGGPAEFTDQCTPRRKRPRSESSDHSRRRSKYENTSVPRARHAEGRDG
ncbi:hypothetical protein FQA39_LY08406 [Lamprigera yunnana]|nr:hypothetical protein FQA39_LY08406 [Lamprigera yunnana]